MPVETRAVRPSDARKSLTRLRRECHTSNHVAITELEVFSYRAGRETTGFTPILIQGTLSRSRQVLYSLLVGRVSPSLNLRGKLLFEKPAKRSVQDILIIDWHVKLSGPASGTPVGITRTRGIPKLRVQAVV
jgi:hypothetical protein